MGAWIYDQADEWAAGPRDDLPEGAVYLDEASLRYLSRLVAPARGNDDSILAAFGKQSRAQVLC